MINSGKLNRLISIQFNSAAGKRDELGGKLPAFWENLMKCWASKETGTITQKEYSGQHMNFVPVIFTIRKPEVELNTAMRIVQDDKVYKIISITELETVPPYCRIETNILQAGS